MALFEWNEAYSVGVDFFDSQHRRLVGMLNDLHEAMSVGKGVEALGHIFRSLVSYTTHHFADEEKAMAKYGCPGLEEHRLEHAELAKQVLEYKKKFEAKLVLISVELLEFLKDWLMNHIMVTDKQYGPYLAGKELP
jgi:hemerythrin